MSLTRIPMTREGVAKSRASRRSGCLPDIQVVFFLPASQGLACLLASRFCRPGRRFVAPGSAATGTAAQLQATEACGSHAGAGAIAHDGSSRGAVPEDEAILYTPEFKLSHKAVTTLLSQEPRATQRTVRQH